MIGMIMIMIIIFNNYRMQIKLDAKKDVTPLKI